MNSFQCVLAADGTQSYAIFLYADEEIQWTTGDADGGVNGLGGIPAQVGFNKGDGIGFASISKSRTQEIIQINTASNTGTPGVMIFKISDETINIKTLNFTTDDDDMDSTFIGNDFNVQLVSCIALYILIQLIVPACYS